MERKNLSTKPDAMGNTGQSQAGKPEILYKVLDNLAPGVAQACPELVQAARCYIMPGEEQDEQAAKMALKGCLAYCKRLGFQLNEPILLTTLNGMRSVWESLRLQEAAGLDHFLRAHKDMFRHYIDNLVDGESSSEPLLPGESKDEKLNNYFTYPSKGS